jgi:hypothetical protein
MNEQRRFSKMNLVIVDPTLVPDWDDLLRRSGDLSFFHSSAWAGVLKGAYGYKPFYFCSIQADGLSFLMPFMEIRSPFTGKRAVSLPFTDQCGPFFFHKAHVEEAIRLAMAVGEKEKWRYLEWRDPAYFAHETSTWRGYVLHEINLLRSEPEIFSGLEKSNQRNIRKAIRSKVVVKMDNSWSSLKSFYKLNCLTRKRQGLPPQPLSFFKSIFDHVLSKGFGTIISAVEADKTIAASCFFHFGTSAIFKYGASDIRSSASRPNNLIMWEAINFYKNAGCRNLSLGRTAMHDSGLLRYKRAWGAKESLLTYYRYELARKSLVEGKSEQNPWLRASLTKAPISVLRIIGRMAYRHVG